MERAKRVAVRLADGFVVPGVSSEKYLRHLGARGPVYVAPNAVDIDYIQQRATGSGLADAAREALGVKHLLLFVGRPTLEKGIDIALEATARLGSEVGLVVLGASPETDRWVAQARVLGVHDRTSFEGFVGLDRISGLMGGADLLLFPSRSDPWGLVINEAQAAGCPVVVSPHPGAVADLSEDGSALVVDLSVDLWASAVADLLQDESRRRRMREGGLLVAQRHSPEACARGLAQVVTEHA
jgi:glycosyltransferase involved in cell wall biosynthesis